MVTHETYRRQNGEWVEPAMVEVRQEGMGRRGVLRATGEPIVIGDTEKMSKSKRNVVAPGEIADAHGVDAARLFLLSDSPPDRDVQWTMAGLEGAARLVNRIWGEFDAETGPAGELGEQSDLAALELRQAAHRTTKAVTLAIESFRFNSAVARLHEFTGILKAHPAAGASPAIREVRTEALSILARLIAPFAPHLAEACWERLGGDGLAAQSRWPTWDETLIAEKEKLLPVQINGRRRGEIRAPMGASATAVEEIVLADPDIARRLEGLKVRKVVVVQDRIVNLVAG
jgi:leucyl-tRNA synthetase